MLKTIKQMELEKIRAADTQIRWQDDDDVDKCVNCKTLFTVTRRKVIQLIKINKNYCFTCFKLKYKKNFSTTVVTVVQYTVKNA